MHGIAARRKLCADGNFIKECLMEAEYDLCPGKPLCLEPLALQQIQLCREP